MTPIVKKSLPHLIAIAIFLIITSIYFTPSIFKGQVIQQSDMQQASVAGHDLDEYYNNEDGRSAWTNRIFSGMPSYHLKVLGNPPNYLVYLEMPIKTIDYTGASMILVALICFYILMNVIGAKRWLAIAGAIAYAFASYNFIIIAVGHITKMYVIGYMPLTIAGMILVFQKKWLWGTITLFLGICFSLLNSHIQITYYLAIFCAIFFVGLAVNQIIKKEYGLLVKASLVMIAIAVISVIPSINSLYSNYEMGQESQRGASELTPVNTENETKASSGLDIEYAFRWSYGKSELMTLLIPGIYGSASVEILDRDSKFYKTAKSLGAKVGKKIQAPLYWGAQLSGTSGPVYYGAVVCFLFILGMFLIKNPVKWWIAGATLFFILLALGKNFYAFNEFLFNNMPMYNKFRAPTMSLVIPGLTFPFIGFWGLKILLEGKTDVAMLKKPLIWSLSIAGGICLLIWIMPDAFLSFTSIADKRYENIWPAQLLDALQADRKSLASSDAMRSLIFILLTAGLILYFLYSKSKKTAASVVGIGILILVTIDLWGVGKRYLNDACFDKKKPTEVFNKTAADEYILQDNSPSYRVLNISTDTFNENGTSFFHKSIGGYHAAKLGRYQELIDHRVMKEIETIQVASQTATSLEELQEVFQKTPTLNMLNTKYVIYSPEQKLLQNKYANKNAWFINNVEFAKNADQEIEALNRINPTTTAVIDEKFAALVGKPSTAINEGDSIYLLVCKPNILKYESNASSNQIAVFSEIYYAHGWKAFIDGKQTDHYRADWTLRAMNIPAGKHEIEFRFEPDTYYSLTMASSIISLILLVCIAGAVVYSLLKYRKTS
ncbi:MAG: YfhO family protein [Dysgonamonadaceae bacterium]|jgi:hypothetical protein|nr:YfhO family protein [Dysgonamonadaceae bacterium]